MTNSQSRFFRSSDPTVKNVIYPLRPTWWSRPYEYAWASTFCNTNDVVLDAACGIDAPFKFYLLDHCKELHACDIDPNLLLRDNFLKDIETAFGEEARKNFPAKYFDQIHYKIADLTKLPYQSQSFDKVFCVSVLEHLNDHKNKYPLLSKIIPPIWQKKDLFFALTEFKRVLRDDGIVILTFDFPDINLNYFTQIVDAIGFEFVDGIETSIPDDAVFIKYPSKNYRLHCFRSVLKKRSI